MECRTGDHTKIEAAQLLTESASQLFDDWFDPIEAGIRDRVREFIEEMIRGELDAALSPILESRSWDGLLSTLPDVV